MSVLRYTSFIILGAWSLPSMAVGLGPLALESGLGQAFKAKIPLVEPGKGAVSTRCIKARLESVDGLFISHLQVDVPDEKPAQGFAVSSRQIINEPAVTVFVEFECGASIRRSYQSLLDFPLSPSTLLAVRSTGSQFDRAGDRSNQDLGSRAGITNNAVENRRQSQIQTAQGRTDESPIQRQPRAKPARSDARSVTRSVLKLADESTPVFAPMKMSDVLASTSASSASQTGLPDEGMLLARRAFAAMLRGEDLLQHATREFSHAQQMLRAAEEKASALSEQNERGRTAYEDLNRKSFSAAWVMALSGSLLVSIGIIGWLARKIRQAGMADRRWWEGEDDTSFRVPKREDPSEFNMAFDAEPMSGTSGFLKSLTKPRVSDTVAATMLAGEEAACPLQHAEGRGAANPDVLEYDVPAEEFSRSKDSSFSHTVGGMPPYQGKMLKVEEVSDVVQEAEFWMLLNDPQRAVQILEPHAGSERPDSPVAWLYLIDLYRMLDDRDKYTELSERFKRIFNARIPKWEEESGNTSNATLEDFPGLLARIQDVWNAHDKIIPFLESLLIDDRDGERIGFDLPVYREIMMLIGVANENARMRLR